MTGAAAMVLQRGANGELVYVKAGAPVDPPDLKTRLDSGELRRLAENAEQKVRFAGHPGAPSKFHPPLPPPPAGTTLTSSGFAVIFGALQVSVGVGFWLITYGQLQFGKLTAFQSYQMQARPTPARLHVRR